MKETNGGRRTLTLRKSTGEPERPLCRCGISRMEDEEREKPMEIRMAWPLQNAGVAHAKTLEQETAWKQGLK